MVGISIHWNDIKGLFHLVFLPKPMRFRRLSGMRCRMFRQQNLSLTKSGVPGFYSVHTMIEEEPCHSLYLGTMIMFEGD